MSALVKQPAFAAAPPQACPAAAFEVAETWWGYVIRPSGPALPLQVALQAAASLLGAAAAVASVGLLALGAASAEVMAMKLGASVVLGSVAALLIWFATRGDRAEIHVDTSLGEVREVVRNRAGRPTLLSRHGFDRVTGAGLRPGGRRRGIGQAWLVLTTDAGDELALVRGPEAALHGLAQRVGGDVSLGSRKAARYEAVYPIERPRPA